jgi:translation initiation factor 2B subunit (eIF-2B alpha/beta/delta family)
MKNFQELLSQLFRGIEIDIGATDLCLIVLESLYESVKDLRGQDLHHFFEQVQDLTKDVESTSPKYAIIIDSFYDVLKLAFNEDIHHPEKKYPLNKRKFLRKLEELIRQKKKDKRAVVEQSKKLGFDGKTILVYSHSRTIEAALLAARNRREHFKVIVAEQDPDKTGELIHFLYAKRIPFKVVPSYMVTHLDDEIDLILLAALTLKSTMDLVMDTGADGLVSQFHLKRIPIYVFLSTSKFSLWKAEKRTEIYKHVHRRKHHQKSIEFERIKFSHDRVELKLVSKIITEEGVYSSKQIEKIFNRRLQNRLKLEQRVELLS